MAKEYETSCHKNYFNAAIFCDFSSFSPLPQLHLSSRSEQGAATSLQSNPTFIQCSCQRPNCTDDDKDEDDGDGDCDDGDGDDGDDGHVAHHSISLAKTKAGCGSVAELSSCFAAHSQSLLYQLSVMSMLMLRNGFKKQKWKFLMAYVMKEFFNFFA